MTEQALEKVGADKRREAGDGFCVMFAEPTADAESAATLQSLETRVPVKATILIGPEGGWTPEELALFQERGWQAASLGTTILRAETAAIAALAITAAELA